MSPKTKKQLKRIGHGLHPLVTLSSQGLHENVLTELKRALHDHELIKIKLNCDDRLKRRFLIEEIRQATQCEVIATIGKIALLYRASSSQNKRLSNIERYRCPHRT